MESLKEYDEIMERLDTIYEVGGVTGLIIIIGGLIGVFVGWAFLKKRFELLAEESSEKSLRKFQSTLDKELVKFQTKHQKQADAIHETFQKFQQMTSTVSFILQGDNFVQSGTPQEEVSLLIQYRHEFKIVYNQNRILYNAELRGKIDAIFPAIDAFIEKFAGGLFPHDSEENRQREAEENGGFIISGIWAANSFDAILADLSIISEDIEAEFRKVYGVD